MASEGRHAGKSHDIGRARRRDPPAGLLAACGIAAWLAPGGCQRACKPGSVHLLRDWATIPLGPPLPTGSSNQPGPLVGTHRTRPLFRLAPGGVCRAAPVARRAVRSCRTLSPWLRRSASRLLSVALSLGSPQPGVTRHRCSAEPGLSSRGANAARGRPTLWPGLPSRPLPAWEAGAPTGSCDIRHRPRHRSARVGSGAGMP